MDKEPITLNGLNKLKDELVFLKEKKRPEIVTAISEARSHGDLKENAEYHAAKEEQSHNEGRITEINDILKYDVYEEVCNKLQLVINKENYDKCKVLFENRSHL